MFTGIITHIGTVKKAEGDKELSLAIGVPFNTGDLAVGASVCCSGVCLTVTEKGEDWFSVLASGETLSKTTLGDWRAGTAVNLERALKAGDELGGHLVSGHVDAAAAVRTVEAAGGSVSLSFDAPEELKALIAPKGSITLDGVSLTVNAVKGRNFTVNAIPHTLETTTLKELRPGDLVNLEIDLLARYVARLQLED
jgi:riboflavin synthase